MKKDEIVAKLKLFIEESSEITIQSPDEALDIDSFLMMLLITYVHQELGVELDVNKMDFDDFISLEAFADLIQETGNAN